MKVQGRRKIGKPKGPFTLGVIPAGYRALVQSAHFYLFLRDTRAVLRSIASGAIFLRDTARQSRAHDQSALLF